MKKLALLILLAAPLFAQDPLQDAQSRANSILSDISDAQSNIAALNQTIAQDANQIQQDQATIASDVQVIASDTQQIQSLQQQLASAASSTQLPSSILLQFTDLQLKSNWILAGGSAGNSGQKGSTGSATFVPKADGTTTFTISPNGPYYDAFEYRKLGTLPNLVAGIIGYRADFYLDSVNLPLAQAEEMDGSYYQGTFRFQPAIQVEMHSHLLRYYNPAYPCGTGTCSGWFSTGITVTAQANQWLSLEVLTRIDAVKGTLTYIGFVINGQVHPANITVQCKKYVTANPWIETSLQLDSNSAGQPYQALVRKVGMYWL